jgi:hypothetical protein
VTRGPFIKFPLGAKLTPGAKLSRRNKFLSLGVKLSPRVFNPGVQRRGEHSPLGTKSTPGGQVHPWGPGGKLRMALWCFCETIAQNVAQALLCQI